MESSDFQPKVGVMQKKKLIGAAAFALALAGGGIAGAMFGSPLTSGAQEQPTVTADPETDTTPNPGDPGEPGERYENPKLDAAATAIGITVEQLRTELASGKTIADVAKARNVDVNTVIDAMVKAATDQLRERITNLVNNGFPKGFGHRVEIRQDLAKIAGVIGISEAELKTAIQSGQSLAQIAQAKGVDPQKVIDALVAQGVPVERATNIVNRVGGFPRHRGFRHDGGEKDDAPAPAPATPSAVAA